jgi:hypothetical protein
MIVASALKVMVVAAERMVCNSTSRRCRLCTSLHPCHAPHQQHRALCQRLLVEVLTPEALCLILLMQDLHQHREPQHYQQQEQQQQ